MICETNLQCNNSILVDWFHEIFSTYYVMMYHAKFAITCCQRLANDNVRHGKENNASQDALHFDPFPQMNWNATFRLIYYLRKYLDKNFIHNLKILSWFTKPEKLCLIKIRQILHNDLMWHLEIQIIFPGLWPRIAYQNGGQRPNIYVSFMVLFNQHHNFCSKVSSSSRVFTFTASMTQ